MFTGVRYKKMWLKEETMIDQQYQQTISNLYEFSKEHVNGEDDLFKTIIEKRDLKVYTNILRNSLLSFSNKAKICLVRMSINTQWIEALEKAKEIAGFYALPKVIMEEINSFLNA